MKMSEIKNSFFNGHSLFGGLTDEQLSDVREFLKIRNYKTGDVLLTQGESNSTLFFIVSGTAAVVKHCSTEESEVSEDTEKTQKTGASGSSECPDAVDSNEDKELARLTKGDSFGEMELIDIQPCAASVIALTDTEVITFTNYDLYKLSKEHPGTHTMIVMNLAREMSRRLRTMDERFVMELYEHTQ
jgi:CRP-like cAMP-binding protein